ncbi:MAG: glucosyl-3-phosphoglycerate synthase [Actinobacteria bacterium]|nr:glucosyl-3-phosphoglycerate synthase [Actinomycetota bacterium]
MSSSPNINGDLLNHGDICPGFTVWKSIRGGRLHSIHGHKVLMSLLVEDIPFLPEGARENLINIAASLISQQKGDLTVLGAIELPAEASLSTGALTARKCRRFLEYLNQFAETQNIKINSLVKVSRCAWDTICATVREESCDLLLVSWTSGLGENHFYGISVDELLEKSPIDTIVVKPGKRWDIKSILVPLMGRTHAKPMINIALAVMDKFGSDLTVMYILDRGASSEEVTNEKLLLASYLAKLGLSKGSYNLIAECPNDVAGSIRNAAAGHDLVIMGASSPAAHEGRQVGPVVKSVADNIDATVLIAQPPPVFTPGSAPEIRKQAIEAMQTSDIVDKWFAENSFHAAEFSDIGKLVELKQKQGLKISLGLPTLNEEETIGNIINTIKNELCDKYPLVDEIMVIDSSSADNTVEIAKSYGVEVFDESEILPEWGSQSGKGGALWKSLYILKGDIIAWIDTDIKNIHPRFIYGLVGPLIKYPRIEYVKGFYRRPVKIDGHFSETGGGRVTELTARPLLNLFFPELSGLVQPLSGEYAGRRDVLEQLGFYNGYGVEIGLLIDILEKFGLSAIGQVDLIERIHRNQSLVSLSKMSFAIIQVVIDRLEKRRRVKLLGEINKTMKLIKHDPTQFSLELKTIEETMRPPMVTLPEYRELFSNSFISFAPELL